MLQRQRRHGDGESLSSRSDARSPGAPARGAGRPRAEGRNKTLEVLRRQAAAGRARVSVAYSASGDGVNGSVAQPLQQIHVADLLRTDEVHAARYETLRSRRAPSPARAVVTTASRRSDAPGRANRSG